ncbi:hypothetical protein FNV43_RR07285 [Rhamnella rubrinervis]|uniref:CASP-like protein n=1 Tax=Rhamnella rubrinervis TaxID=2594499 RepID=A0A8K0MM80_9ROSA|nr:hypothetical protein FNV43_RR07285 [Rhamnella rubrinervis]
MAFENRGKPAVEKPIKDWRHVVRMVSFLATASATLVMAFSKETKTLVVANIGGVPIKATISAKFQHTPAFVFFVIANGMASLHNLLMIMAEVFRDKMFNNRGVHLVMIAILDMMTVALASAGAARPFSWRCWGRMVIHMQGGAKYVTNLIAIATEVAVPSSLLSSALFYCCSSQCTPSSNC